MDKTISLDKKQVVPLAMQIFNVIAAQVAGAGYTHFIIIKNGGSIEADEMSLMGASIRAADIVEKIGKDNFIMFESGVHQFHSYSKSTSVHGGLSHPTVAFETKEDRDIILDMILEVPFHKALPSSVLFADFVDGEVRAPLDNTTQWTVGKGEQPKYVIL